MYNKIMKEINFNCPGFYTGFNIYKTILILQQTAPETFNSNIKIESIFDSFPNMTWNGGSINLGYQPLVKEIEEIINFYFENNIEIALTLTNPSLTKEDLYDRYCNKIVTLCENENNSILVSSPILEKYIRDKYPKYKIKRSIIASNKDVDYLPLLNEYDKIVLPRRQVKNFNFLNSIPIEVRDRFELLCNDPCPSNCPYIYKHYKGFAKTTLYEKINTTDIVDCKTLDMNDPIRRLRYKNEQITFDEIIKKYLPLSYNSFKLSGRTTPLDIIFSIVPFFFKQEYQLELANYLCCRI